jgi:hypothetical protein
VEPEQRLLHLEIQIEEDLELILFSVQLLRPAAEVEVLETQDKEAEKLAVRVVVDLKTQVEAQEIHQRKLHLKELMAVQAAKGTLMTAEAAEAAEALESMVEAVLERLVLVLAEMEPHQLLLRVAQLSLMLAAAEAVARFVLPAEAEAVLAVLVEVVRDVISHPRPSLVQQAMERQT